MDKIISLKTRTLDERLSLATIAGIYVPLFLILGAGLALI